MIFDRGAPLATLLRTGGGRCNLTNATYDARELAAAYPRGGKFLLSAYARFGAKKTMTWFEEHGLPLAVEGGGRVFPAYRRASEVRDLLLALARSRGVRVLARHAVSRLVRRSGSFQLTITDLAAVPPSGRLRRGPPTGSGGISRARGDVRRGHHRHRRRLDGPGGIGLPVRPCLRPLRHPDGPCPHGPRHGGAVAERGRGADPARRTDPGLVPGPGGRRRAREPALHPSGHLGPPRLQGQLALRLPALRRAPAARAGTVDLPRRRSGGARPEARRRTRPLPAPLGVRRAAEPRAALARLPRPRDVGGSCRPGRPPR